jgi:glycosyltransferase involved in cell wall biosynthesis
MGPLITVITPTYNRAELLPETIRSILAQTYANFEYFIIDDGSTDNTEDIVKPFLNDNRVKYYRHDNMGESKTTNRGYGLANGELSIVINSDDPLFRNDYFDLAVNEFINEPDILAVYCDWVSIDINSTEITKVHVLDFDLITMATSSELCLGPGMMIKLDILKRIGFRNEKIKYTGDLDISFKLARLGKIKHIKVFGATHRDHPGNAAKSPCKEEIAKELLNLFLNIFQDGIVPWGGIPLVCIQRKEYILLNALSIYKANNSPPIPIKFSVLALNCNLFKNTFDKMYFYFLFLAHDLIIAPRLLKKMLAAIRKTRRILRCLKTKLS